VRISAEQFDSGFWFRISGFPRYIPRVPRAIALETSSRSGSVALVESDGTVIGEEQSPQDLKHAAALISILDSLAKRHGWTPRDVREIYVSAGPGSFTGLRVGITAAKTLALSLGANIVAVPTTDVLARNAPHHARNILIVLDAKRGQIFTARYTQQGGDIVQDEPAHLDTLAAMLARTPRPVYLIGEGIPYHRAALPAEDPQIILTPEESWRPRAAVVAHLGHQLARVNQFTDPDRLTPLYLRRPEAEEKWEQLGRS
jgi:tRNA threonylcarbamoyladenosine biosynthesis protein TsaB